MTGQLNSGFQKWMNKMKDKKWEVFCKEEREEKSNKQVKRRVEMAATET